VTVSTTAGVGGVIVRDEFPAYFPTVFGATVGSETTAALPATTVTTAAQPSTTTTWLDVVPAYVYSHVGTPVAGSGTTTTAGVG
jgi:hypothetical protein